MEGPFCPIHNKPMRILPTHSEYKYYCEACNKRYNDALEVKPRESLIK